MNNEKQSAVKKSIRIQKCVASEIEKEAAKKNQSFSDTVNYRLQHFQSPLTPAIMGKIQNIANIATMQFNQTAKFWNNQNKNPFLHGIFSVALNQKVGIISKIVIIV